MALFKILKGDSSRIDVDVTPFHDGYAYFTPDDGGFYIDSEDDGEQRRIRINPPGGSSGEGGASVKDISTVLPASGWDAGKQTISVSGLKRSTNGVIGVAQDITNEQMESAKNAELYVCAQGAGTLTIAVFGETPAVDIPVVLILFD